MKPELISQAEFARRIGVSAPAVSKLVKRGQISTRKDGLLDYPSALKQYNDNLDPARRKVNPKVKSRTKKRSTAKLLKLDAQAVSDITMLLQSVGFDTSNGLTYELIRTAESIVRTRDRALSLSIKDGQHVKLADVQYSNQRIAISVKRAFEGVPARCSDILAARLGCDAHTLSIELTAIIKETLNTLADPRQWYWGDKED